jgi:hypothetical protein
VILGITLSIQLNPDFVNLDLDMRNAHTFSSRDKTKEELETNIIYNYLLEVFKALYGKNHPPMALRGRPGSPPHELPPVH